MTNGKKAAAGGAAVLVAAVVAGFVLTGSPKAESKPEGSDGAMDFTIPDMNKSGKGERVTKEGCVIPPRPQWVADAPVEDWKKASLISEIYDLQRKQAIIESQNCSCETEYPAWEAAQAEFDKLTDGLTKDQIIDLNSKILRESSNLSKPSRDICRAYWSN